MKLALFDGNRLGVVVDDDHSIVDVSEVVDTSDRDPLTAGWWRALCRDWADLRERVAGLAAEGTRIPVDQVRLDAPALAPSKVLAAASNYRAHVQEMHDVQERTLGTVHSWMMEFDVFLKSPSSLTAPAGPIVLPAEVVSAGQEIHHESELVIVVGAGGKDIPESEALGAVFGFTAGLDITVRSPADRSRRKSYDTFSPLGPWIRIRDDDFDGNDLDITLTVDGQVRQSVNTTDLITPVARIVSYASSIMTLHPGDLIFTGAPPGVGPINAGETLVTTISGIGTMTTAVA
ncbi:fumarylacetoacetate hydrolase family protein [Nakamurella leprariae]|uniref:Fumarylacetoacetate hydrolase family protein n=1 Tax=Nakamurella leprariae TaxID=2803911 RepID=A0A938YE23_9ACTN|nr:fumarylacetoacetate hydrolase family protein [Nakamurella leprariae]MBM9468124.1 fumarylacetoacetate hydrolase family protein [Nakamurella leprariae]